MDWVAGILTFLSTLYLVKKHPIGWVFGLLSQIPWWFIIYQNEMWGISVLQVSVFVLQIWGVVKWKGGRKWRVV